MTENNVNYEPLDPSALPDPQRVSMEELAITHTVQIEALIRLGMAKGLWTRGEALTVINATASDFTANRRQGRN